MYEKYKYCKSCYIFNVQIVHGVLCQVSMASSQHFFDILQLPLLRTDMEKAIYK